MNEMNQNDMIDLDEEFIVIAVPKETIELTLTASIFHNGQMQKVQRYIPFTEVRDMMSEAQAGYVPSDAVFTLVKSGKDKIEELLNRYITEEHDE